ncbi:MAG: alpha/beta hydrolase family esterase [Burkholderiales bacterium]
MNESRPVPPWPGAARRLVTFLPLTRKVTKRKPPAHVIPANAGSQCNRLLGPGFPRIAVRGRRRGDEQRLAYCATFSGPRSAVQKGHQPHISLVLVFTLVIFSASAETLEPGDHSRVINMSGEQRSYVLHMPPLKHKRPLPLVLMLHGAGGNAAHIEAMTGMSEKADEAGFAIAYPNGSTAFSDLARTWNAGRCCGPAAVAQVDDVAFLKAVLKDAKSVATIGRVFVAGFSNGGMMAYRLTCELGGEVAAVAVIAATFESACKLKTPTPLLAIHGVQDGLVPFDGFAQTNAFPVQATRSVSESVTLFARANGCEAKPAISEDALLRDSRYASCDAAVRLIAVKRGAHAWPGGKKIYPWEAEPTHEISATDVIWKFFSGETSPKN